MAKSLRSKTKRAYRHKKREDSTYAASDAARLARINAKLSASASLPTDAEDDEVAGDGDAKMVEGGSEVQVEAEASLTMDVDPGGEKKISTHGPRNSRREQWRASKGLTPRPKSRGMNKQGGIAAARKPGRSHRRR